MKNVLIEYFRTNGRVDREMGGLEHWCPEEAAVWCMKRDAAELARLREELEAAKASILRADAAIEYAINLRGIDDDEGNNICRIAHGSLENQLKEQDSAMPPGLEAEKKS